MPKKKTLFETGTCVAPIGLTLPHAKKRLDSLPEKEEPKDPEHIMMKLWAEQNTRDSSLNFGLVPIDTILHRCTAKCSEGRTYAGTPPHEYFPPNEDELRVINATIQWVATNCGRAFLHKFQQKLKKLHQE